MGLRLLVKFIKAQDPAIKSTAEVFLYQGFWAIFFHRISHFLYNKDYFFISRLLSQIARFLTGIEIHPGARISQEVFIDHGAGVVIGETAIVGNRVVIFHGVTLGGTGKDVGKRHPTISDDVVLGANAAILGPVTIGRGSKIGANTAINKDVPPYSTIVGEIGRNPHLEASLRKEIERLKNRLDELHPPSAPQEIEFYL